MFLEAVEEKAVILNGHSEVNTKRNFKFGSSLKAAKRAKFSGWMAEIL